MGECPGGLLRSASPPCCLLSSLHLRGPLLPPLELEASPATPPDPQGVQDLRGGTSRPPPLSLHSWGLCTGSRRPHPITKLRTRKVLVPGKGEEERAMGVFGGQRERKGKAAKEIKIPLEKASRRFREVQTEREQREDGRAGVPPGPLGLAFCSG